jgi:hypothetical protein
MRSKENPMRSSLKHFLLAATVAVLGASVLSAQPDRLHRVLDPLGILPPPRQVLRSLDRVAHSLPPVIIETEAYPDCGYYRGEYFCRFPDHRHYRSFRHERWEHRRHGFVPMHPGRPRHGRW